jgi:predicted NBD/HSP70 family sugar kinase
MTSLGIDVGGSSVKLAAVRDGQTLWQTQTDGYKQPSSDELVAVIGKAIGGRFERGGVVGICVPGTRDLAKRIVIRSVNLPALNGLKLDDLVHAATGIPAKRIEILSDSTANAFDIYEIHKLSGRLLSLAIGTGIGAAVLDDGVPLMVHGESPGHVGQFDVSVEGDPVIGPDGGTGGLEGYFASPALMKRYGNDMAANLARLNEHEPPMKALSRAIRICHAIYCPDHVALTGGVGNRMGRLLPVLRKMVDTNLTSIAKKDWTFLTGHDDFHAALGAAKFASAAATRAGKK